MTWKVKGSGTAEFRGKNSCRVEFQVQDDATGIIRRERKTFEVKSQTKKEKERCKREFRAELETGIDRDERTTTFSEYAERWLAQRKANPEVAPSTYKDDEHDVRTINLTFGKYRISAITRMDVKEFQLSLVTANEKTGKAATLSGRPMAGTTANGVRHTLKQILREAVRDSIIATNPCDDVKPPSKDTKEKEPLTIYQVANLKEILDESEQTPLLVGIRLALFAGLRRGEICALQWRDFDAKEGTLKVRRAVCSITLEFKETKTEAGERTIPIDAETVDYLLRFKAQQERLLLACGKSVKDACIVAQPDAKLMDPARFTQNASKFCRKHGFEATPHVLRHTYCTLLFASGVDLKTVQYLMGHDDPQTTLNVYTHYVKSNGEKAANAVAQLMASLPSTNVIPVELPAAQLSETPAPDQSTPTEEQPEKHNSKAKPKPDFAQLRKAV